LSFAIHLEPVVGFEAVARWPHGPVDQYFLIRRVHSTAEDAVSLCTTFNIINDLVLTK